MPGPCRQAVPLFDTISVSVRSLWPARAAMLLDLSRIRGGVEHVERRFESSVFSGPDEAFRVTAPVDLKVDVQKDGRKARLSGRVATTLECECSRCLEPFNVLVDVPLDLMFLPAAELSTGAKPEAEDDEGQAVE